MFLAVTAVLEWIDRESRSVALTCGFRRTRGARPPDLKNEVTEIDFDVPSQNLFTLSVIKSVYQAENTPLRGRIDAES